VTGARNFLSYNETSRDNPLWYGKIYGDGSVFVKGDPGVVNINVDMATAPRSIFTFVLSDQEVADEFSFLTFRDKTSSRVVVTDSLLLEHDTSMDLVNRLRAKIDAHDEEGASDYNISLQMRVTPEAQINLVMDPVGGDRIRAYGSGHLRLDYGSANNDLKMYGTYTLDRGDYNFTLQEIIIKEFTIKPGSSIAFQGDPYSAQLNIRAAYALNANLSDLDESFLQDKDLNRTNVPVHAVLNVTGDMRQPQIAFDLEFPTLNTDVYRKVRSIISTDDMMNRQIIYLLALNRFYTPEYMASTTKGNELVSVASSTISSQLSNLLGQISDNWNIAPTFRSDRGDFSDVEVDVALSSRLLNNRLLFNGNFGYRDNSMNTSQFVGDFDLEYLLDRMGMWRLKAYNRYNDQNYYLRTAPTTQGVGVVLKRDFDSFLSFLKAFRRKDKDKGAAKGGSKETAE
nr:translocation/assembly module TamB [Muribaculaceae bacterium]